MDGKKSDEEKEKTVMTALDECHDFLCQVSFDPLLAKIAKYSIIHIYFL